jgi:hypothetical protein
VSHHFSGPDWGFPRGDARLDFTDLYVFPAPGDSDSTVLVLNLHPSVGENPPGPTTGMPFSPEALYEVKIDTNGDAIADIAYRIRFTEKADGTQAITVRRVDGAEAALVGDGGDPVIEDAPVSAGSEPLVAGAGGYRLFAGWRSDPFFFDRRGALNELQFTGDDFFADKDVSAIVLEVPGSDLGSGVNGVWARTLVPDDSGWVQVERCGRPAQAAFLISGEDSESYQAADPADDAQFVPVFAHALESSGGYPPEEATRLAETLLPDMLPYDPALPASYPANGRPLTADIADAFLALLTNGQVSSDQVGPHTDLLAGFPYLGQPHSAS